MRAFDSSSHGAGGWTDGGDNPTMDAAAHRVTEWPSGQFPTRSVNPYPRSGVMRLHVRRGGEARQIAVRPFPVDARIADLSVALGMDPAGDLRIDDVVFAADTELVATGLVNGSSVCAATERTPGHTRMQDGLHLACIGGPDAGGVVSIPSPGAVIIGRSEDADVCLDNETVSERHAVIRAVDGRVTVEDLESTNGTWLVDAATENPVVGTQPIKVPAIIRIGSSRFAVRSAVVADRPDGTSPVHADEHGRVLVNRPPRLAQPATPGVITLPDARPERPNPFFSPIALVAPIVFGAVMVVALGSWRFAIFAVLSPLMLVSGWLTNKRRVSLQRRTDAESWTDGLARMTSELETAAATERARRMAIAPDLAEVRRRASVPSVRLWERRLRSPDSMCVGLGWGTSGWTPQLDTASAGEPAEEVQQALSRVARLDGVRLSADLRTGPLGIVGHRGNAVGLARSVLAQLAVHHGPADLSVAILTSDDRVGEWAWASWLPHTEESSGAVRVFGAEASMSFAADLLAARADETPSAPSWLLVVDDVELVHHRGSPIRTALEQSERGLHGVVVAATRDQLPASVGLVVDAHGMNGEVTVAASGRDVEPDVGLLDGLTRSGAERLARTVARWDDPERGGGFEGLPSSADGRFVVPAGVNPDRLPPEDIRAAWKVSASQPGLPVRLGPGVDGPVVIDLVADGPHTLIAGTTGSGKSELLRSLILGLCLAHGPDELVAVLVDYKGGAAFDALADLPHVVGMVTDLDAHLSQRALRSMEAELHLRERLLRRVGVSDLESYRDLGSPRGPLPRLLIVIDEFATLKAELPDFVGSLIGVAQRGRSLGVHLVLATQRPAGAVDANIRANTNLRIALRMQDAGESMDIIDARHAAELRRDTPGRAWVRRGSADLMLVQSAFVSGPAGVDAGSAVDAAEVHVGAGRPPVFAEPPTTNTTFLADAVEAARAAIGKGHTSRTPWLPDLEPSIEASATDGLDRLDGVPLVLGVGDDPDAQRRVGVGWNPNDGPLLAVGALGSGTTTLLRSLTHLLAGGIDGQPAWVFAADHGAGGLHNVSNLRHVSCVLTPEEEDRHGRVLDVLDDLVQARRSRDSSAAPDPVACLVIDGIAGFCETADVAAGGGRADQFHRIVRDGPAVGVVVVAAATRAAEIPRPLLASARTRFVMELADPLDYGSLGIRSRQLPAFRPGRALLGSDGLVTQVVDWSRQPPVSIAGPTPPQVEGLGEDIDLRDVPPPTRSTEELSISIGVQDRTRRAAGLTLESADHVLIAGPARSGRTTALRTIARQLRSRDPNIVLVGVARSAADDLFADDGDGTPFDAGGTLAELLPVLGQVSADSRTWVVVVDDADRVDDPSDALHALIRLGRDNVHVIASIRASAGRQGWSHWTRALRSGGKGLLLHPENAVDGDLLGVRLPRAERLEQVPGRGYLVHGGTCAAIQVAR